MGSNRLGLNGLKELDFTASVCAVEVGKDRQKIVWAWEPFVSQMHPLPGLLLV
jgi:hypothetical protein